MSGARGDVTLRIREYLHENPDEPVRAVARAVYSTECWIEKLDRGAHVGAAKKGGSNA